MFHHISDGFKIRVCIEVHGCFTDLDQSAGRICGDEACFPLIMIALLALLSVPTCGQGQPTATRAAFHSA
jgi:hypothetical protein